MCTLHMIFIIKNPGKICLKHKDSFGKEKKNETCSTVDKDTV